MRPEKAYRKVRNAIKNTLNKKDVGYLVKVKPEVEKLLDKAVKHGYDSPRYYDDFCFHTLHYISDRFNCAGRLRWILYVIDKGCLEDCND